MGAAKDEMIIPREPKNRQKKRANAGFPSQQDARNRGRRGKAVGKQRQGHNGEAPPQEERQRKYLEQLNQQAEIAMRVLEREKAELAVMKEKVVGSWSSEGKRKVFDKSQIPGLSPRADEALARRVASPQRFDNI